MKKKDLIAVYSRKSKFTGTGESIGNQVDLCKEFIRTHYGSESAENAAIYEDEGFSGGNLNRPAFKKMMQAAHEGSFKAIVVYRLDRISRNISDFSSLIEQLSHLDTAFISIKEQFDTSTPMGRAMMYIASVFSQLERETIAERIRDNMHELAKTGRWLGGTTPTGYTSEAVNNITINGKSKKSCRLKILPKEAEIVRTIYDLYLEHDSQTITESLLIKRNIRTKNDKYFTRFSIKAILQNPVYAIADPDTYNYFCSKNADLFSTAKDFDGIHGIMAYNRTDQKQGKTTVYLPVDQWIISVGQHPGLIPGKSWIKVQESLARNKSGSYRKPRNNEALLTGVLYCSCGNRMYPKLSRQKTTEGIPLHTYVCKMKERSRRSLCQEKNANGNALDTAVLEQIKLLKSDFGKFASHLKQGHHFHADMHTHDKENLALLRKEASHMKKKMEGLVDSLADLGSRTARQQVIKRIEQLNQNSLELNSRICELESFTSQYTLTDIEFNLTAQTLSVFSTSIDEMSLEQKRTLIRTLIQKVIWDGSSAHVIFWGTSGTEKDKNILFK